MRQHYTEEQANAILRRAIERMPMKDEMSRAQLESIATELGVSPDALQKAEADWEAEQAQAVDRAAFIATRRADFRRTFTVFAVVNVLFFLWCLAIGREQAISLAIVVMIGSTIGLALRAAFVLRTDGEDFELRFTRWRIERRARELAAQELGRIAPRPGG
ncbi:MAG TPA: 2TM domain-containing protein [Armatimonadota bacterium]|jgi:hypothetical protein